MQVLWRRNLSRRRLTLDQPERLMMLGTLQCHSWPLSFLP